MIASMVPAAVSVQAADGDSIRLVNGKIEVDAQLKKLAEMYEKETGTKVEIESMGGGIDIQGTLKGYYQSDNMPDIFVNGGATDFANWTDLLVDMSDQEWASDTDAAYVDESQVQSVSHIQQKQLVLLITKTSLTKQELILLH